jgi:16S rRNA (guanine527-N7)-methyltransferase
MSSLWNGYENEAWLDSPLSKQGSESVSKALKQLVSITDAYEVKLGLREASGVLYHLQLMLGKNEVVNLTSIRDPKDALVLHSFDSLLFYKVMSDYFSSSDSISVLDMGTGGGFPGIPLSCVTDWNLTLLDSVGKKVTACNEFIDQIGMTQKSFAVHERLEDYAKAKQFQFDAVCARALASLDVLIEYGAPYVKKNGYLFFGKANPEPEELDNAKKVAKLCGFEHVSRETFELPEGYGHREIFVYKKVAKSAVKLPRKNGEARRNPLANR